MRLYAAAGCLVLFLMVSAGVPAAAAGNDTERYNVCARLASQQASAALAQAEVWLKKEPGKPAALHCKALALFTMGQFGQAAALLETLMEKLPQGEDGLWLSVAHQAGLARAHEGQWGRARTNLGRALAAASAQEGNEDVRAEILLLRSQAWVQAGRFFEAINDAEHALALMPDNTEALSVRAGLFMQIGGYDLARQDYQALLAAQGRKKEILAALYAAAAAEAKPKR